jgi:sugar phosphate isomerase/epimerase
MNLDDIVASPCSLPALSLPEVLAVLRDLGYRRFEAFTSWVKSAFDFRADPAVCREVLARHGFSVHSLHLPPVTVDRERTLADSVLAARFAKAVGAEIVLFKAATRELYVETAGAFLDATQGLGVTAVVQNHKGTALSTLDDVRAVLDGVADDRMRVLLEVGQFHSVGVPFRDAHACFGSRTALVHIKDQVGGQSVPFGAGEIDLPGLFELLDASGYHGKYVVEMEVADPDNTPRYLAEALTYLGHYAR